MLLKKYFYKTFDSTVYLKNTSFLDRGSFDQNSLDQNCVLSLDQNFDNQLTKFFDTFHLIESFNNDFGQTPKLRRLTELFDQLPKKN